MQEFTFAIVRNKFVVETAWVTIRASSEEQAFQRIKQNYGKVSQQHALDFRPLSEDITNVQIAQPSNGMTTAFKL